MLEDWVVVPTPQWGFQFFQAAVSNKILLLQILLYAFRIDWRWLILARAVLRYKTYYSRAIRAYGYIRCFWARCQPRVRRRHISNNLSKKLIFEDWVDVGT
jgi:hypothetical protein